MPRKSRRSDVDALVLLERDHAAVKQLFLEYEQRHRRGNPLDLQAGIVGEICLVLSIHAQIEEEIFYPALHAVMPLQGPTHEGARGHDLAQALIARLDEMEPGDAGYADSLALLRSCVLPHMDEEQADIFPCVRAAGLDTAMLGRQLAERQRELHDDVTRLGLPRAAAGMPYWPVSCRVVMA